jgi:hypothetical protein
MATLPIERTHRREPREHPHATGADEPGERAHTLVEALAEDHQGQHEDEPLPDLVEPDRRDRTHRPGRVHDVAQPVAELHRHPPHLVAQQLGRLRQLQRPQVAADVTGQRRGAHPHRGGERNDRDGAEGVGHESAREHTDEQGDRAAHGRDGVRGEQVLGRHETGHHRLGRGEVEAVHRGHEQRPAVVERGLPGRAREHEEDGRRPQQRGHDHDAPA